jgi:hypothetical protein
MRASKIEIRRPQDEAYHLHINNFTIRLHDPEALLEVSGTTVPEIVHRHGKLVCHSESLLEEG